MKLKVLPVQVASPDEFERAFEAIRTARVDAIRVGGSPFFVTHRQRIIEFAARERLPTIYWWRGFSDAGGLMSYGVDAVEMYRNAPTYVDKITWTRFSRAPSRAIFLWSSRGNSNSSST